MKDVLIHLSADPRVCQCIDIMVVEIPEAYGLILIRVWSTLKLSGLTCGYHTTIFKTKLKYRGNHT